ncbi:hypothetical protein [Kitasatospora sp. NPDC058046]|uniref:hypothetical protein n=1 Tax=Kitasatospora sp. NPDC058046 TaxID=3346312 RepID=UPI0036DE0602
MPTLPHTGLQTPDQPRYEVTAYRELTLRRGFPFKATLSHGRVTIGSAENHGTGGDTEFVPRKDFNAADFERFADACRLNGRPLSTSLLLDLLVKEYSIARALRAHLRNGRTMVREVTADRTRITANAVMPETAAARKQLLEALGQPLTLGAVTEFWNGSNWEPLTGASDS